MIVNIFIGFMVCVGIAAGIFSWKLENGCFGEEESQEKEDGLDAEKKTEMTTDLTKEEK